MDQELMPRARGVRRGRWADRNVGARGPRLAVLAFILASVFTGLWVLIARPMGFHEEEFYTDTDASIQTAPVVKFGAAQA